MKITGTAIIEAFRKAGWDTGYAPNDSKMILDTTEFEIVSARLFVDPKMRECFWSLHEEKRLFAWSTLWDKLIPWPGVFHTSIYAVKRLTLAERSRANGSKMEGDRLMSFFFSKRPDPGLQRALDNFERLNRVRAEGLRRGMTGVIVAVTTRRVAGVPSGAIWLSEGFEDATGKLSVRRAFASFKQFAGRSPKAIFDGTAELSPNEFYLALVEEDDITRTMRITYADGRHEIARF